jgi:hypothetical protein
MAKLVKSDEKNKTEPVKKIINKAKASQKQKKTANPALGEDIPTKKNNKRLSPVGAFEEAFNFAKNIYKLGAGEKVRRLTLFDDLGKSPDSGASRMLITNSSKYGLTKGGYQADFLELTAKGNQAVSDEQSPVLALKAKFELSVSEIDVFNFLYNRFSGNKLPTITVITDLVFEEYKSRGIDKEAAIESVETFIVNIKYLGLLQTISGAERLISLEHALEKIPSNKNLLQITSQKTIDLVQTESSESLISFDDFENICFYITPIGSEDSEFRKHSDLFLESIISPVIQQLDLKVVRADQIDKPGTITNQIIEYIFKSKLVIADLSFHNPNVFYELALRHVCRLPTVQIIRKSDRIPFDLSQSRTIIIDTTDIYTLVPKLETYKAEIASQVRQVLGSPDSIDNPVTNVFHKIKLTF